MSVVASWNVNGIRAVVQNNDGVLLRLLNVVDVLCLQETKIDADALEKYERERPLGFSLRRLADNFDSHWAHCETKKGYCGVATYVRRGLLRSVTIGFGFDVADEELVAGLVDNFASSGRVLVTDHASFVLFNLYFPNTNRGDEAIKLKMLFQRSVQRRCEQLSAAGRRVIVIGDVNIVPQKIDTTMPNKVDDADSHCYFAQERDWLSAVTSSGLLVDAFRAKHAEKVAFSFHNPSLGGSQMRIDLALLNAAAVPLLDDVEHRDDKGSDHTPVVLRLNAVIRVDEKEQLLVKRPVTIQSFFKRTASEASTSTIEAKRSTR